MSFEIPDRVLMTYTAVFGIRFLLKIPKIRICTQDLYACSIQKKIKKEKEKAKEAGDSKSHNFFSWKFQNLKKTHKTPKNRGGKKKGLYY